MEELKFLQINSESKGIDFSGIINWAEAWDWGVGKLVAKRLSRGKFTDLETIFVATVDGQYAGLCKLQERDGYGTDIDPALTPFIASVYVDPAFRGRRLVGKLLDATCDYARSLGFESVYIISSHKGLYEKYGFEKFTQTVVMSGRIETLYKRNLL